jgi:hypothetical protein
MLKCGKNFEWQLNMLWPKLWKLMEKLVYEPDKPLATFEFSFSYLDLLFLFHFLYTYQL